MTVSVEQMTQNAREFIDRANAGETVAIVSDGAEIARLVPPVLPQPSAQGGRRVPFPDMSAFRASIHLKGEPMSETVIRERREERF